MAGGLFTDWGTKSRENGDSGGITIESKSGKRVKKIKTKREPKGSVVGSVKYDRRRKPKEVSSGKIGYSEPSKPETVGGISYGARHKPEEEHFGMYATRTNPPKFTSAGGISYEHKDPVVLSSSYPNMDYLASEVGRKPAPKTNGKKEKKGKPLFGEKDKLTVSEEEAKARIKAEKKRIRELEREQERKNKKRLAAYKKSVKAQKKALEFSKQTPLAKLVRKRLRKLF